MTSTDPTLILPTGWRHDTEHRYLGPAGERNEVLLILNHDDELGVWSYNLDARQDGEELREYNGAFKDARADAFVTALADVPSIPLDALPRLFTAQGLRISWFRGQQAHEIFLPEESPSGQGEQQQ